MEGITPSELHVSRPAKRPSFRRERDALKALLAQSDIDSTVYQSTALDLAQLYARENRFYAARRTLRTVSIENENVIALRQSVDLGVQQFRLMRQFRRVAVACHEQPAPAAAITLSDFIDAATARGLQDSVAVAAARERKSYYLLSTAGSAKRRDQRDWQDLARQSLNEASHATLSPDHRVTAAAQFRAASAHLLLGELAQAQELAPNLRPAKLRGTRNGPAVSSPEIAQFNLGLTLAVKKASIVRPTRIPTRSFDLAAWKKSIFTNTKLATVWFLGIPVRVTPKRLAVASSIIAAAALTSAVPFVNLAYADNPPHINPPPSPAPVATIDNYPPPPSDNVIIREQQRQAAAAARAAAEAQAQQEAQLALIRSTPITVDTDLRSPSGETAAELNAYLAGTPMAGTGESFILAEQKYHVNARYLVAHAILESDWGNSYLAQRDHNLFGYGAWDRNPNDAYYFPSDDACIQYVAMRISQDYLTPGGAHYVSPTLRGMNVHYASDPRWADKIARIANEIPEPKS